MDLLNMYSVEKVTYVDLFWKEDLLRRREPQWVFVQVRFSGLL